MRIYLEKNVLESSLDRIRYIFDEFGENIWVSVSGGKDSGLTVQLVNKIAQEKNKKFNIIHVDLEAFYSTSEEFIIRLSNLSNVNKMLWICLPLNLSNALSIFEPMWHCWEEDKKDLWVRPMPKSNSKIQVININNIPSSWTWYHSNLRFIEFVNLFFDNWSQTYGTMASVISIRTQESLHRWNSIVRTKNRYKGVIGSTKISDKVYNFYPIYDYKTEDVWRAVFHLNLEFNEIYEMMYKNGISIHEQRICHPYGEDQRKSLNQWSKYEPEIWNKVVNRVSGTNLGNIYCKTTLLGHNGTNKPEYMSWEQYAVFLLETIALYSEDLEAHYFRKIKNYMNYYKKNMILILRIFLKT